MADEIHIPDDVKAAHDLGVKLRADGYSVGFEADDVLDEQTFADHKEQAAKTLFDEDVASFYLAVERDQHTDYSTSCIVQDQSVWGISQIQMLGAHFRMVHDALPLSTSELIDAMVDEAITIDEDEDA